MGVTIPAVYARSLSWHRGDEVRVYLAGEVVCIQSLERGTFAPRVIAVPSTARLETSGE